MPCVYALIEGKTIPVEVLKSVTAVAGGNVLISGAAGSEAERQQVRSALSNLKKKDLVSFNVVTSDWKAMTGTARIRDLLLASKPGTDLHFFVSMKVEKGPPTK